MILAGKKSTILKSQRLEKIACLKCKSEKTTDINVIGSYKHLLQIPFLSAGKKGESSCIKCGQKHELHTMPDPIKLAYYELKELTKTPIWFYSGLIAIKVLVLIKIFSKYY